MNNLTTESSIIKNNNRHARFIKIKIYTDEFKLNLIPIPIIFAKGLLNIAIRFSKFSNNNNINTKELLADIKLIIKELKSYPPLEIINIESSNTKVIIKTT